MQAQQGYTKGDDSLNRGNRLDNVVGFYLIANQITLSLFIEKCLC